MKDEGCGMKRKAVWLFVRFEVKQDLAQGPMSLSHFTHVSGRGIKDLPLLMKTA